MIRPAAHAIITTALLRYGLSLSATAALLAGCGGSQPPFSVSPQGLASQQSRPSKAYDILHEFGDSADDGKNPAAELVNVKGTLYGTTVGGGSDRYGTVFSITTSGQETVLHSFGGTNDGANPSARLLDVNGTLYGTTTGGGNGGYYSAGTVFSLTPSGKEKVLHSFNTGHSYYAPNGGLHPNAGLIDVNGTLYGTTEQGGNEYSAGTVFSITTSGKFKVLHRFGKGLDGANPAAALLDVNGTLYGTTVSGGKYDGTVFSITTDGKYRTLYSFGTNQNDGNEPLDALINLNGTLYGTTSGGGDDSGTVFGITTGGSEKIVYSFALNGSDGSNPVAGLIDFKGVLYGTTSKGGAKNVGTVFSVTTSGEEAVLHSFRAGGGVNPRAGLLEVGGTLYGTTYGSINQTHGNVFSLKR